jgi:hypothetical protein
MHGERGVRMEENEVEEDDDSYPMSPKEYGDTAMEDIMKKREPTMKKNNGHRMSPLMALVRSFLMQSNNAIQKGRS